MKYALRQFLVKFVFENSFSLSAEADSQLTKQKHH